MWPDWGINCNLGKFSKPVTIIILPKLPTLLGNFCIGVKIFHFQVKSFLGNFYRHLANFYWSHCLRIMTKNLGWKMRHHLRNWILLDGVCRSPAGLGQARCGQGENVCPQHLGDFCLEVLQQRPLEGLAVR